MLINPYLGDMSGKLSGLVFMGSSAGNAVRRKSMMCDPRTSRQTIIRSRTSGMSKDYSYALDQAQRDGWDDLAAGVSSSNPFGSSYGITGQNLYVRINNARLQAEDIPLADSPADLDVTCLTDFEIINSPVGDPEAELSYAPALSGSEFLYLRLLINASPGLGYVADKLRFDQVLDPLGSLQPSFGYADGYPSNVAGKVLWVEASVYNSVNGVKSPAVLASLPNVSGP